MYAGLFSACLTAPSRHSLNPALARIPPLPQCISNSEGLRNNLINQENAASDPILGLKLFQAHLLKLVA